MKRTNRFSADILRLISQPILNEKVEFSNRLIELRNSKQATDPELFARCNCRLGLVSLASEQIFVVVADSNRKKFART